MPALHYPKARTVLIPPFTHADIHALALLQPVLFLSNWSMKVETQEDTEVFYVFMRERLLEPVTVFCVVPANWHKAVDKLVVTLWKNWSSAFVWLIKLVL